MTISQIINQLEINQGVFRDLLLNKVEDEYFWRPEPNKWCLLEIVCHLLDEEQDDFRSRVKHTLETPSIEMSSINPEGWVLERDYISQNYKDMLQAFLSERSKSVIWLKKNIDAQWDNVYQHPKLGELSAKLFLSNWLAHDYLHFRQINRYQYIYLKEKTNMNLQYAGNW
ncbi:DinB family protein [Confluentibacter flavum]|uniref:DinB-like domain-containing protein n=1 Tax=Confluentibacter flavum TaxID=1909700 RepID=A0A2N3HJ25_9FLAO|nr:DinB family protein [Confluentibacter flavum]PKQ44975.1 hypothetical protein CSW08_10190 [Confluentibacter flavum]